MDNVDEPTPANQPKPRLPAGPADGAALYRLGRAALLAILLVGAAIALWRMLAGLALATGAAMVAGIWEFACGLFWLLAVGLLIGGAVLAVFLILGLWLD
jgi:hypothetical protein